MFSQPWLAWPREAERRGVIFIWGGFVVDMIFLDAVLAGVDMEGSKGNGLFDAIGVGREIAFSLLSVYILDERKDSLGKGKTLI